MLLITILLGICVVLTSISSVSAASTVYVNATGSDTNPGTIDSPYQTIAKGINSVEQNGTVQIADGTYSGKNNTNLTISKNMTITGQNQKKTIINGTGTNWIFKITSGVNVTITNLTLTNATADTGGAICNNGTLSVTNCIFTSNKATISTNTDEDSIYGGGAIFNTGTINTLSDCNFTDNNATNGGAILNAGTITSLSGCNFTDSTATNGGAILNYMGNITSLNGCNFTGNTATGNIGGGAILNAGTITSLSGCNFTGNTAVAGGAILNYMGNITCLSGCNFTGNTATIGGAIFNGVAINGKVLFNKGTITSLNGCNFTGNTATGNIGGGAILNAGTITSLSDCNFTDNTATNGGAILNYVGTITSLSGCNFTDSTATNGGAILNVGTITSLSSCNFTDNTAEAGGAILNGGIIIFNGEVIAINSNINILSDCSFTGNTATDDSGGAIYNIGTLNALNSNFTSNNASNGGAIYNNGNLTVTGCNFVDNAVSGFSSLGGSIFNDQYGNLTVSNSTFTGNNASSGGAVWSDGNTLTTVIITGSTFKDNTATNNNGGGAVYNGGILTISNSKFINNSAISFFGGGAICNAAYAILTVSNSTFLNNIADSGGAIYNQYYGNVTILNSTLTGNNATTTDYGGGAIYNDGDLTVKSSTLNNNHAINGGAVYNTGTSTVNFNRIIGNTAGAIYNDNSFGGSADADYNWWGSNSPTWSNLISGFTSNPNYWVILSVNATPTAINNTQNSTVTADLNHYINITGHIRELLEHIPDGQIKLDIHWGSFTSSGITHSITLNTTDDVANATFYADEGAINPLYNPVKVNADADDYTTNDAESAYIWINPVAHVKITKTVNNSTPNYRDSVIFTITAHNEGPDTVTGLKVTDLISKSSSSLLSNGLTFVSANTPYGTYNSNTGIWDIGSLLNGEDAVLNITCNVTGTGTIVNWANITAQTTTDLKPWSKDNATLSVPKASNVSVNTEFRDLPWGNVITKAHYKDKIYVIVKVNNNGPDSTSLNVLNSLTGITWTGTYYVISNIGSIRDIESNWVGNDTTNTFNGTNWDIPSISSNLGGTAKWLAIEGIIIQTGTLSDHSETVDQSSYPYDGYNSDTAYLTADAAPTSIKAGNATGVNGKTVNLTAALTDTNGNPLAGKTITFTVNGKNYNRTTDEDGLAALSYTISETAGIYTITTSFAGDNNYTLSSDTGNLTVDTIKTTLTVNNITEFNGKTVNLKSTLKDENSNPLTRKTITFTVNGTSYTAVTDDNGIAEVSYDLTKAGNYSITASFIDGTIYANSTGNGTLTVKSAANLYINTKSGNPNPNVGETFLLTYKLGNYGPDAAENVTITFQLPEGLDFVNIHVDSGKCTYNETTRTVTWTIDSVPVGDPYLYLTVQAAGDGTYNVTPNITSDTYNANTGDNGNITINVQPNNNNENPNNNNENPNNEKTVNAASKTTIRLHDTGLPLNYLLLAILMVLSGLMPRKK